MKKLTLKFIDAWKIYSEKAPVNYLGPQLKANQAYRIIEPYLTGNEKFLLMVARDHASIGEGRKEFDGICKQIAQRLKLNEKTSSNRYRKRDRR